MICPDLITGSVHLSVRVREIQMCHTGVHGYALLCIMYILLKFWKKFIEFRSCTQYQIDNCLCKEKLIRIEWSLFPLLLFRLIIIIYIYIYIFVGFFFFGGGGARHPFPHPPTFEILMPPMGKATTFTNKNKIHSEIGNEKIYNVRSYTGFPIICS